MAYYLPLLKFVILCKAIWGAMVPFINGLMISELAFTFLWSVNPLYIFLIFLMVSISCSFKELYLWNKEQSLLA